ncbi:MAG TPA: alpha/beta fold hydrolase, partial [Ramlibacter sp.]
MSCSNRRSLLRHAVLLALAAGAVWSPATFAQGAWPAKPITMVVPFPPGGVADTVARPVAEALSRELKQPVVVCVHGLGGSSNSWTPLMPALARHRVIRVDLPGSGRSQGAEG